MNRIKVIAYSLTWRCLDGVRKRATTSLQQLRTLHKACLLNMDHKTHFIVPSRLTAQLLLVLLSSLSERSKFHRYVIPLLNPLSTLRFAARIKRLVTWIVPSPEILLVIFSISSFNARVFACSHKVFNRKITALWNLLALAPLEKKVTSLSVPGRYLVPSKA